MEEKGKLLDFGDAFCSENRWPVACLSGIYLLDVDTKLQAVGGQQL